MNQPELLNAAEALREFAAALELCGNMPKESFAAAIMTVAEINKLVAECGDNDREIEALESTLPCWGFEEALDTMGEMPIHLRVMSTIISKYLDNISLNLI